jgi:hypothetical protein
VAVDAQRELDGVEMLRTTYFVVTTDAPAQIWELDLPPLARLHGLGALGMLGIVFSALRQTTGAGLPVTEFDLFTDPADISAVFSLEERQDLSVHLEDIWLPLAWCEEASVWGEDGTLEAEVARGDVFRVDVELFQDAYRYGIGDIGIERFMELDPAGRVFASPQESEAVRGWAQGLIEQAKSAFEDKELKLRVRTE